MTHIDYEILVFFQALCVLGKSTGITIIIGRSILGSPVYPEFNDHFVHDKIKVWVSEISMLLDIASSHPQSEFFSFVNGFSNRWTCLSRTCPGIDHPFQPIKDVI